MTEPTGYLSRELGPDTWIDFERLFAKHAGVGGCWCMYYQRPQGYSTKGFSAVERYEKNRRSKESLVDQGRSHGILLYDGDKAVGWCAYGLKDEFPRIDSGRNYRRLNLHDRDQKLWRITCFFVDRDYRKRGVAQAALKATIDSIKKRGGGTVEAYPVTAKASKEWSKWSNWFWFGTASMFAREKFKVAGQMGPHHLLMRRIIRGSARK